MSERRADGNLTVAVTGPTGEVGKAVMASLERTREVGRILGMARRQFDPEGEGWNKTAYRRGDVLDRRRVAALVEGADVVVHLAFLIMGSEQQTRRVNLDGSRYVFEAAVAAGVKRIVYTSSVAAYGYKRGRALPLTEDTPPTGSPEHYYSAQSAAVEEILADTLYGTDTQAWVLRPCIVAGPRAPLVLDSLPYPRAAGGLLGRAGSLLGALPGRAPGAAGSRARRSSSSITTTSRPRSAPQYSGAANRAPTTSRGPARSRSPRSLRSSAGTRCPSPHRRSASQRGSSTTCAFCRHGRSGSPRFASR